jgi:NTE family protein
MSVKIGLALGGGGARGLAHVGVLKVFQDEGIPIHCIAGASVGAVVGAMYAQNQGVDAMIERFKQALTEGCFDKLGLAYLKTTSAQEGSFLNQASRSVKRRIVINLAQNRQALLKAHRLSKVLESLVDEGNIEDTIIPLRIVATNLNTGADTVFRKGDIFTALSASSAIPGFLSPLRLDDNVLIDGGASCPVPVRFLAEMGANITIGIDISMRKFHPLESLNAIEIISRAELIASHNLARMMAETANIAIFPDTNDIHWSEFSKFDELFNAGVESAREKMPAIKKALRKKTPWYRLFW